MFSFELLCLAIGMFIAYIALQIVLNALENDDMM